MRQRRRRPPPALAAVVTIGLALAPLALALPSRSAPAAAADVSTNPIRVTITRISPIAPQPGDTLVVAGELQNVSDTPVADLSDELKMGSSQVGNRGSFDVFADDQDGDLDALSGVTLPSPAPQPTLAPGQSEHYQLSVPVNNLGLDTTLWQVRELGVSVTSGITPAGTVRTFLPWAPRSSTQRGQPTEVSWIWPLIDRPHRTTSADWFDGSLAPELTGSGRLNSLLAAGAAAETQQSLGKHPKNPASPVPVTWALDPMLISDASTMTTPYKITSPGGKTTNGAGGAAAKSWLTELHAAIDRSDADVLPLPYGDPDVAAAVRSGLTTSVGLASAGGRASLQQVLGTIPRLLSTFAWPPGGFADQRAVNGYLASGDNTVVLSGSALPPVVTPQQTPSAPATLTTTGGPVDAILTDPVLSATVSQGADDPADSRIALQRFLAETLMIHAEAPSQSRSVVIAPNRRWAPSPAYADALLADTGKVPWIKPESLAQVATIPSADSTVERSPLAYPPSARHNELSPSYLDGIKAVRGDVTAYSAILPTGSPEARVYTSAIWRALSSAWRSQRALAGQFLASLSSQVKTQMNQVRITSTNGSFVTLTSHGGNVPVTIANRLSVPVTVTVHLLANQRLTLSQSGRRTVALPPHQQTVVKMHAAAKTSGVFPVKVQLQTPKGNRTYGTPVQLFVRSTVYGTITLVITGAATAALMIAVGIRLTRRALAARRSPPAAAT